MQRIAECCCGSLTIEVKGEPEIHGVCHCNDCKKRTGSAFGISAYFLKENIVSNTGLAVSYQVDNELAPQQRHFCTKCGTTLYWHVDTLPNMIGIAAGCFVEEPLLSPDTTITNENKCSWLTLPDDWKTSVS